MQIECRKAQKAHIFKRFKSKKMSEKTETKTRLKWLMEYPEPYRTQAIENTIRHGADERESFYLDEVTESAALYGFDWESSPEKKAYWENFYARRNQKPTKFYRYPWNEAPDWATCAATDEGGLAFWYGVQRFTNVHGCNFSRIFGEFEATDWQNSLEIRPPEFQKQNKSEQ